MGGSASPEPPGAANLFQFYAVMRANLKNTQKGTSGEKQILERKKFIKQNILLRTITASEEYKVLNTIIS